MRLNLALRGYAVGLVLGAVVLWAAFRLGGLTLMVVAIPLAGVVFTAAGTVGIAVLKPGHDPDVSDTDSGGVHQGGVGFVHVAGNTTIHFVTGHRSPVHEVVRVIRMSGPDPAFGLFLKVEKDYYADVLRALIEDGEPRRAADLLRRLADARPTEAGALITSREGCTALAELLPTGALNAQDRYAVAAILDAEDLANVLTCLPQSPAATLLSDVNGRDSQLARHALDELRPERAALVLSHASGRRALVKTVAQLSWRRRRRILRELQARDGALAAQILRGVARRRWVGLGAVLILPVAFIVLADDSTGYLQLGLSLS